MDRLFAVTGSLKPSGDQPAAIDAVAAKFAAGEKRVVLAGATGTGKSATAAWVLERLGVPALVLAPNKVLAAQLAAELRELLPGAFVGFFVSHFAYYRPEAYVASTDTFVEKDSAVDAEIERLRHEATVALLTRRDVVIVASISAIYGLGRPGEYRRRGRLISPGDDLERDGLLRELVAMGYDRNDEFLDRGRFRVRGDTVEIWPAAQESLVRVEFFGDTVDRVAHVEPGNRTVSSTGAAWVFPTTHHVTAPNRLVSALEAIRDELEARHAELEAAGKLVEAQRLRQRTEADLESLETTGFCRGIENYSRHFDGRPAGEPPSCLLEYFPEEFLLVVDESHVTVPQLAAMYEGDQSRKRTLVEYGFRLPSALDNRPLSAGEFWPKVDRALLLSATPGRWEAERAESGFVDQVIRPTALVDPQVLVVAQEGRLEDLLARIAAHRLRGNRALVTTLTKRQAEQLTDFLSSNGVRVRYLHSDVAIVERIETIRALRTGSVEVIVGVNLLREGLDLPEVGLVAILDADAQGFLRSSTALVQTIGRASRNPEGEVVLYADVVTPAMRSAIDETDRRRAIQVAYNEDNGLVPMRLSKAIVDVISEQPAAGGGISGPPGPVPPEVLLAELRDEIDAATAAMREASARLEFEEAARWRDLMHSLRRELIELTDALA